MTPVVAMVTGPEILIVGVIILVLFGADRLPKLARSMGQAKKEFEAAIHTKSEPAAPEPPAPPAAPPASVQPPDVSTPSAPPPPQ